MAGRPEGGATERRHIPLPSDIAARYLFGGSALDSGVQLDCALAPAAFAPKDNAELSYGVLPKGKPVALLPVKL